MMEKPFNTLTFELYTYLAFITAFFLLFFSVFLFTHKKGNQICNKMLSIFLFSKGISLINILIHYRFADYFYQNFPHVFYAGSSFEFLWGPSLYFYIRCMLNNRLTLKPKQLLHLAPFVLHSIYSVFAFHIHSTAIKQTLIDSQNLFLFISQEKYINSILQDVQALIYIFVSFHIIWRYSQIIKEKYSNISEISFSWLRFILFGFVIAWIIGEINYIYMLVSGGYSIFLSLSTLIILFIFAIVMVFKTLNYPEIFTIVENNGKYRTSKLKQSEVDSYLKQLLLYMKNEKPYLSSSLEILDLCQALSIPRHHLSQIINESLNKNFFDFVNGYRIDEAKQILTDSSNNNKTILEILYEVGFNSKSAFNRVFKTQTGMSPTEFKNIHRK